LPHGGPRGSTQAGTQFGLGAALAVLYACANNPQISGVQIGNFTFTARVVSHECPFVVVPDNEFQFDAILSHDPSSTKAFMRVGSAERDAGSDGQYFVSLHSAPRQFSDCGPSCDKTRIDEPILLALLSRTHVEALNQSCPPNPLGLALLPI